MNEFNRTNLHEVRAILDKHLAEAGKELGILIKMGSISFSQTDFTTKLKVCVAETPTGEKVDKDRMSWDKNNWFIRSIGLKEDDFHKPFVINGTGYKIVEVSPRRYKRPIIAQRDDGKRFVFQTNTVLTALGRNGTQFYRS